MRDKNKYYESAVKYYKVATDNAESRFQPNASVKSRFQSAVAKAINDAWAYYMPQDNPEEAYRTIQVILNTLNDMAIRLDGYGFREAEWIYEVIDYIDQTAEGMEAE